MILAPYGLCTSFYVAVSGHCYFLHWFQKACYEKQRPFFYIIPDILIVQHSLRHEIDGHHNQGFEHEGALMTREEAQESPKKDNRMDVYNTIEKFERELQSY